MNKKSRVAFATRLFILTQIFLYGRQKVGLGHKGAVVYFHNAAIAVDKNSNGICDDVKAQR
jgi:hypothetical protein